MATSKKVTARKPVKVRVSARALIGRLNRAMHDDDLMVRKSRPGSRAEFDLGTYFLVNWKINGVVGYRVDLEETAREYGVLADYEELAEE